VKLSLIIPALNEAEGVAQTVEKLHPVLTQLRAQHEVEVIFVDDGSKDETFRLLTGAFSGDPSVKVIPHGVNKGLGGAIRTGFQHAQGDVMVTTDFDGTYPFSTIPALVDLLISSKADLATASPYHPQGMVEGVPPFRLLFSKGASWCYRLVVKSDIHTWTSMYRAYRRPLTHHVTFEDNGFMSQAEIMVNTVRSGYRVVEFPTTLYRRSFGQSSIKVARVTSTHVRFLWYLLGLRLTGRFALSQSKTN
jgi:dolichol-phosphate mannosyltransferase